MMSEKPLLCFQATPGLFMVFPLLLIAFIVATNSNAWFGTAVLVTNMKNFPLSRGTVAGILKWYAAIGGAVYIVIYNVFLDQSSTNLPLFLALGNPVICWRKQVQNTFL
ncbi:Major facilitator superfamily protein [Raphanus sativus]|nr:Major facilitator superfamily protein [Raphanus sativus]